MLRTLPIGEMVRTLREMDFDGVATACVFAWEERAKESSAFMLDRIRKELAA